MATGSTKGKMVENGSEKRIEINPFPPQKMTRAHSASEARSSLTHQEHPNIPNILRCTEG